MARKVGILSCSNTRDDRTTKTVCHSFYVTKFCLSNTRNIPSECIYYIVLKLLESRKQNNTFILDILLPINALNVIAFFSI